MKNKKTEDRFRANGYNSERMVQGINSLLTVSVLLNFPSIVNYSLCLIGVAYLVYLVKAKGEKIDGSKTIPFLFFVLFFVIILMRDLCV